GARAARDARILGRSGKSLSQGNLRLGQEVPLLLSGWWTICAGSADSTAHGFGAGLSHGRRIQRLEGGRRSGRTRQAVLVQLALPFRSVRPARAAGASWMCTAG